MITFNCCRCNHEYCVKNTVGGKKATCGKCKVRMVVPMPCSGAKAINLSDPQQVEAPEVYMAAPEAEYVEHPFVTEIRAKERAENADLRRRERLARMHEDKAMDDTIAACCYGAFGVAMCGLAGLVVTTVAAHLALNVLDSVSGGCVPEGPSIAECVSW